MQARDKLMLARELMTAEQALAYMTRISDILRGYLEARFLVRTTRQTTREFFHTISGSMAEHPELAQFSGELKSCLERCDLAKFAHQPATAADLAAMENSVLSFVNTTEQENAAPARGGGR